MTKNEIDYMRLKEDTRSHKAQEELTDKGQKRALVGAALGSAAKVGSAMAGGVPGMVMQGREHAFRAAQNAIGAVRNLRHANDPKWYTKYPELVNSIANLGALTLENGAMTGRINNSFGIGTGNYATPFGIRINYWPTLGTLGPNSPVERAAMILWSDMTANIGRIASYDKEDLIREQAAILSVYEFINELKRYYAIQTHSFLGSAYTKADIAKMFGFDYTTTTRDGLSQLRKIIDKAIAEIGQVRVFTDLAYALRRFCLSGKIFADEDKMMRPQYYFFVPKGFYTMNVTGGLNMYARTGALLTLQNIETMLDFMITAVLSNSDTVDINSDITRYLEKANKTVSFMAPCELTPKVDIVYDKFVLDQIHNATAAKVYNPTTSLAVNYDNTYKLYYGWTPSNGNTVPVTFDSNTIVPYSFNSLANGKRLLHYYGLDGYVLNSWFENPTVDYIMESSRLTVSFDCQQTFTTMNAISNVLVAKHFGTEIVEDFTAYFFDYDTQSTKSLMQCTYYSIELWDNATAWSSNSDVPEILRKTHILSKFHGAPRFSVCPYVTFGTTGALSKSMTFTPDTATSPAKGTDMCWEIDYIRYFPDSVLADLHYAATLSEWKYDL